MQRSAWIEQALRPFRAAEYIAYDDTVDLLSRVTLTAMEGATSLSEIEKHVLARSLSSLPRFMVEQLFGIFLDGVHELDSGGISGTYRRLHVRIGTLKQLPHVLPRTGLDIEAAARQMSRTLADIVEDETESRHKVALDLVRNNCRGLRVLAALCDAPSDGVLWMDALVVAMSSGDVQLFLDSLLRIPRSDTSQQLRRDVEALSQALSDHLGSQDDDHFLPLATRCQPLAQAVFAPASIQVLLSALEVISVSWEAGDLGAFALFMQNVRGEMEAAQGLYERAIEADPHDANNLGNFAGFLFASGQHERGREVWQQARELAVPGALLLELEFYAYALLPDERERALGAIEAMLNAGVRSPNFDLSRCVERARMDQHPEADRVSSFARRIAADH